MIRTTDRICEFLFLFKQRILHESIENGLNRATSEKGLSARTLARFRQGRLALKIRSTLQDLLFSHDYASKWASETFEVLDLDGVRIRCRLDTIRFGGSRLDDRNG